MSGSNHSNMWNVLSYVDGPPLGKRGGPSVNSIGGQAACGWCCL